MNPVIRIQPNIYHHLASKKYEVIIEKDKKRYSKSFCFTRSSPEKALQDAINWKQYQKRILGIQKDRNNPLYGRTKITATYSNIRIMSDGIRVRMRHNYEYYCKVFPYSGDNFSSQLEQAIIFRDSLYKEFGKNKVKITDRVYKL